MKSYLKVFIVLFIMMIIETLSARTDIPRSMNKVFIMNKGQWPDEVKYLTRNNGLDAWITAKGIVYDFYKIEGQHGDKYGDHSHSVFSQNSYQRHGHVVRMNFVDSEKQNIPEFVAEERNKIDTYYNYFIGKNPARWADHVPLYTIIQVEKIYRNISARYYYDEEGLRYDIVLNPGAETGDVQIAFEGSDNVAVGQNGELEIHTSLGKVVNKKLLAYQEISGRKKETPCRFIKGKSNRVGFKVNWKDKSRPLVIDPLIFSTFIGGSVSDGGDKVAMDGSGNLIIAGWTRSNDFPSTLGAYDRTYNGEGGIHMGDVFISKLSADGSNLIFSTFIGGSLDEGATSCMILNNDIYFTGWSISSDFPTTAGAFDTDYNGASGDLEGLDVIAAKLSSDGSTLIYSTYIGGSDREQGMKIAVDGNGNAVITGVTASSNFPTTLGAFDQTYNGGGTVGGGHYGDVFVSKLNSNGTALVYSTYVGGGSIDCGNSLVLDNSGNAIITGLTYSSDFPTTTGAYDNSYNGGAVDAFLFKLNSNGNALVFSSFVGGGGNDWSHDVSLDSNGNIVIGGRTESGNFPTTPGAYDVTYYSGEDVFVSKFNSSGSSLLQSTLIGGGGNDQCLGIALDGSDNVVITGSTTSGDYPTTTGAFDNEYNGGANDVFVSKLKNDLSNLLYSSYVGGSNSDNGHELVVDVDGNAIITGITGSSDFPATVGAYDQTYNGGVTWGDVFVTKIRLVTGYYLTMAVNQIGWGTTTPSVGDHVYNSGDIINISANPSTGYQFVNWIGDVANRNLSSTTTMMNGNKTVTANFKMSSWIEFASLNQGRFGLRAAAAGDTIYVCGGHTNDDVKTFEKYCISTNTWSYGPSMATERNYLGMATVNGKIYVFGGYRPGSIRQNTTECYDPMTGSWQSKGNMPSELTSMGVAVYNGKIYSFGGENNASNPTNVVYCYDPVLDKWETVSTTLPTARKFLMATTAGNKIYVMGGYLTPPNYYDLVEVFDPNLNSWSTAASIPLALANAGTDVSGDTIYVFGGETVSSILDNLYKFNIKTNGWSTGSSMILARSNFGSIQYNSYLYAIGGTMGNNNSTYRTEKLKLIEIEQDTLTMAVNQIGWGTTTPTVGDHVYNSGEVVNISATPASNYHFVNWTGDVANLNLSNTTTVMNGNKTVTANFQADVCTLKIQLTPPGGGTTTPVPGTYTYPLNTVVTLSAVAADYHVFRKWTGGVADSSAKNTTVLMNANKTVTAHFKKVNVHHAYPNGNEFIQGGVPCTIRWDCDPPGVGTATIKYSVNGGVTYPFLIVEGAPNTGSYVWNVPLIDSQFIRIKVEIHGSLLGEDESDFPFTIDSTPPTIILTYPTGGETWFTGGTYNITWIATDNFGFPAYPISIQYTFDKWHSYKNLTENEANDSVFTWTVPAGFISDNFQVKVRVTDLAGNVLCGHMKSELTIKASSSSIRLTSPIGGELFRGGSVQPIRWVSNVPSSTIVLKYSTDGGNTYPYTIVTGEANDGEYLWTVPTMDTKTLRVKAQTQGTFVKEDDSDGNIVVDSTPPSVAVLSPNGGMEIESGGTLSITWTVSDNFGLAENPITLFYSKDGGISYPDTIARNVANNGTCLWNVPEGLNSTLVRIRAEATDKVGLRGSDASDGDFSVYPVALSVALPNGGEMWPGGSVHEIRWRSNLPVGTVTLKYSTDGGASYPFTIAQGESNDGSYPWKVPEISSASVRIKVEVRGSPLVEASNDRNFTVDSSPPVVRLLTLNGGEKLEAGTGQRIGWSARDNIGCDPGSVKVYCSMDGGLTYPEELAAFENGDSTFVWTPPKDLNSTDIKIKVEVKDLAGNAAADESDQPFTVMPVSFKLLTPNGGEVLQGMTTCAITWTSNFGTGAVTLKYSTDGGMSYPYIIASNLENNEKYLWSVPSLNSPAVRIKAELQMQSLASDESDGEFSIEHKGPAVQILSPAGTDKLEAGGTYAIKWNASDIFGLTPDPIAIRYSTDGGIDYPNTIAEKLPNTGAYVWSVPKDLITNQLRIRIEATNGKGLTGTAVNEKNLHVVNSPPRIIGLPDTSFSNEEGVYLNLSSFVADKNDRPMTLQWKIWASNSSVSVVVDDRGKYCSIFAPDYIGQAMLMFRVTDPFGESDSDTMTVNVYGLTGVLNQGAADRPAAYRLSQNYPNPFNPTTKIVYELPEAADVRIIVFDMHGKKIVDLEAGRKGTGTHTVVWNAADRPSGMYLIRLEAGDAVQMRKCILMK